MSLELRNLSPACNLRARAPGSSSMTFVARVSANSSNHSLRLFRAEPINIDKDVTISRRSRGVLGSVYIRMSDEPATRGFDEEIHSRACWSAKSRSRDSLHPTKATQHARLCPDQTVGRC